MKEVNMNKVAEALSKMTDESQPRDRKFEELIKRINEEMRDRDLKTEKRLKDWKSMLTPKLKRNSQTWKRG